MTGMQTMVLVVLASGFSGFGGMLMMAGFMGIGGQGNAVSGTLVAAGGAFMLIPAVVAMLAFSGMPSPRVMTGTQRPVIGDKEACMPGRSVCAATRKRITDRIRADIDARITQSHVTSVREHGRNETIVRPAGTGGGLFREGTVTGGGK